MLLINTILCANPSRLESSSYLPENNFLAYKFELKRVVDLLREFNMKIVEEEKYIERSALRLPQIQLLSTEKQRIKEELNECEEQNEIKTEGSMKRLLDDYIEKRRRRLEEVNRDIRKCIKKFIMENTTERLQYLLDTERSLYEDYKRLYNDYEKFNINTSFEDFIQNL